MSSVLTHRICDYGSFVAECRWIILCSQAGLESTDSIIVTGQPYRIVKTVQYAADLVADSHGDIVMLEKNGRDTYLRLLGSFGDVDRILAKNPLTNWVRVYIT